MSRLLFTLLPLLPLLFGCGAKETAIPEYHTDNGRWRMYVATPTNGETVLRERTYAGDSLTSVKFRELEDCVVFAPDSWSCTEDGVNNVTVDAGELTVSYGFGSSAMNTDEPARSLGGGGFSLIFTRVRP